MLNRLLNIVAETDDFIVVNKPPNIDCMSSDGSAGFFTQIQSEYHLINPDIELKPVHRLDKMTSGLMLFAKSSPSAAMLAKLFAEHHIQKYYLALSHKKPKKKQGLIVGDMVKSRRGQWRLARSQEAPAKTRFLSVPITVEKDQTPIRLFVVRPYSGKTHQIRVALNSLGSPIMGDKLYGGVDSDRGYLHAYVLRFELNGQQYHYQQPPQAGEWFLIDSVQEEIEAVCLSGLY